MSRTKGHVMNRRINAAFLSLSVLGVAGCGGGGGGNGTAKSVDYTSASSIATALDANGFTCTAWTPEPSAIGPKEAGNCQHDGTNVEVATYATADQMTADIAANDPGAPRLRQGRVGGLCTGYVQGDTWMVTPGAGDRAQAAAVRKIVGGTIK
jgi:hypothetical protein